MTAGTSDLHSRYAKITARHSMDIELYYWALGQVRVFRITDVWIKPPHV